MKKFPKIQKPCPVKNQLSEYMVGDTCRKCERQVVNLDTMSSMERESFLSHCSSEVCVSYSIPLRAGLSAIVATAALTSGPVHAQEAAPLDEPLICPETAQVDDGDYVTIMVGGIKRPSEAEWIDVEDDVELPAIGVVFEVRDQTLDDNADDVQTGDEG